MNIIVYFYADIYRMSSYTDHMINNFLGYYGAGYIFVNPFNTGTVFIRQIMTYKDGPRTERITIFILVVDP